MFSGHPLQNILTVQFCAEQGLSCSKSRTHVDQIIEARTVDRVLCLAEFVDFFYIPLTVLRCLNIKLVVFWIRIQDPTGGIRP
jgi:hypothetical protein